MGCVDDQGGGHAGIGPALLFLATLTLIGPVVKLRPSFSTGWINMGRTFIQGRR
jgi:hypothetical protein